jgi:SAM-dependent methyltransferase
MANINYTPTEKLVVNKTVSRIDFITNACINKSVLDLGCFDETALIKENTGNYLFSQISNVSAIHIGVDSSKLLPDEGIIFSDTIKICKGDIYSLEKLDLNNVDFDVIIAGELIEHLPNTLDFLRLLKKNYQGKRLICSTPNATSFSNILLSFFKRESAHIDHLQVYSFKTLNTICRIAGFKEWQIIPYHVKFTEMKLRAGFGKRKMVQLSENIINSIEQIFPMTAGGYLIDIVL